MELFVDEEGVVLDCEVSYPELSEELAQTFCERTIGEDAGEPATGPDGEEVPGIVALASLRGGLSVPSSMEAAFEPDFALQMSRLPDGMQQVRLGLLVYVDQTGAIRNCQQVPGANRELSQIACETASGYVFEVRTKAEGDAVGYVMSVIFEFTLADAEA